MLLEVRKTFKNQKFTGSVNLLNCELHDCDLRDCRIMSLAGCKLFSCDLTGANFTGADVSGAECHSCKAYNCRWYGITATNDCRFWGGLKVNAHDAYLFLIMAIVLDSPARAEIENMLPRAVARRAKRLLKMEFARLCDTSRD